MGEVIAVDFLKGRPSPPRPARVRVVNDLTLRLLRQMAEHRREADERFAEIIALVEKRAGRA